MGLYENLTKKALESVMLIMVQIHIEAPVSIFVYLNIELLRKSSRIVCLVPIVIELVLQLVLKKIVSQKLVFQ